MKKPSRKSTSATHKPLHTAQSARARPATTSAKTIERYRGELEQRKAELAIINGVQQGLAARLDVQAIYDLVGDKIREIFNAQAVMISIYDPQTDMVEHRYAIERGKRVYVAEPQPVGGFRRRIIESAEPLLVNTNVAEQASVLGQPTLPGTEPPCSWLGVPMLVGKRVTGVTSLQNLDQENAFNESDVRLLQTLASSMSVAIENARLFDQTNRLLKETEQRNAELALINSLQAALTSRLDIQGIYEAVGDKIREIFHNTDTSIRIYDPKTHLIHFPYNYDDGQGVIIDSIPLPERGFGPHVIRTGETIVVNETMAQASAKYGSVTLPGEHEPKSSVFVPLVVGEQVRGLIRLKNLEREHAFSDSDVRLLQTLANAMSVALENARLFDETQRLLKETEQRATQLATVNRVSHALASQVELDALIQLAGQQIRETFSADIAYIALLDPTSQRIQFPYTFGETFTAIQYGEGLTSKIIETRQPLLINRDMETRRAQLGVTQVGIAVKSYLGVPILVGAQAIGVVSVQSIQQEGRFNENDQHLLMTIAANVGVAIERARHYDAEQRRAEQFRVISEVGHRITALLPVETLLSQMATLIRESFDYYQVGFGLIEGDVVVSKAEVGPLSSAYIARHFKVGTEGLWGWVAHTGEPLLIADTTDESRFYIARRADPVRSQLCVLLKTKVGVIGVLGAESDRPYALDESDMMVLQSLANQAAVAIENAQRFDTEKRRAEQFQIIAEIGHDVASLLDTNQIMHEVTVLLRQAFDYYHVGIGLIEGDEVVYRVGSGVLWDDPNFTFKPQRLRIGKEGLTGWVATHDEPVIVADVSQDPRYVWLEGSATRSELLVPIIVKEEVVGVLDVQSDKLNAFDNTDLAVVQSIAHQTGAAIENARLYERAQELAVMQERNRLARDLHDAVTQTLFSASLIADALPSTWESDPNQGRQLLKELRQLSRGALAEMRTLLLELRPAALVETHLDSLLRQLCEAAAGREGLLVNVDAAKGCKLPAEAHIAFYRIAQEALNNILKHSRATHVAVGLSCRPGDHGPIVELAIRDDGRGFEPAHVPPDHFGLRNMRERAQAIGAELNVTSKPGHGTRITVVWENKGAAQ